MPLRLWQYQLAKLGDRGKRRHARMLSLTEGDLPGGNWRTVQSLTWRAGAFDGTTEPMKRALKSGGFTTMRHFEEKESQGILLVRIIPYTNAQDAEAELQGARRFITFQPRRGIVMGEEVLLEGFTFPDLPISWAFEQNSMEPDTSAAAKVLAGVVDNVLLLLAFTGETDSWTWPEIADIAEIQAKKIRDQST